MPAPRISAPLQSSLRGTPASAAAASRRGVSGCGSWLIETLSGPPTPWYSDSPPSKSSDLMKNGSTSAYDQPGAPLYAQSS